MKSLLAEQSRAEWPSYLKDMCAGAGMVREDLHFKISFGLPCSRHLKVPRLLQTILTQFLSSDEICSDLDGLPGKETKFSLVRLPLLKASSGILAYSGK